MMNIDQVGFTNSPCLIPKSNLKLIWPEPSASAEKADLTPFR
jgi:hypothetical protein